MGSNYSLKYNVDIVMCIDSTGSMHGILDTVKKNALNFDRDLVEQAMKKGKQIDQLRIRVISFRDYLADGENAMLVTDFFDMPKEKEDFNNLVNSIKPDGGGDDPEDGLEALAYAIKSKWTTGGDKRRHIIVVWTDASTHPLGFGKTSQFYPEKMAKTFDELTGWWDQMDSRAKRLLIYAPEDGQWKTIPNCWNNIVFYSSVAGMGLEDHEYNEILNAILNSI